MRLSTWSLNVAGVMGLMSVWVGGLEKPCTGYFGASAMSAMSDSMSAPATTEHPLTNGALFSAFNNSSCGNMASFMSCQRCHSALQASHALQVGGLGLFLARKCTHHTPTLYASEIWFAQSMICAVAHVKCSRSPPVKHALCIDPFSV